MLIKVIKRDELYDWVAFKIGQMETDGGAAYKNGYIDALENLKQDIIEGRLPTHLFSGSEEESVIL